MINSCNVSHFSLTFFSKELYDLSQVAFQQSFTCIWQNRIASQYYKWYSSLIESNPCLKNLIDECSMIIF